MLTGNLLFVLTLFPFTIFFWLIQSRSLLSILTAFVFLFLCYLYNEQLRIDIYVEIAQRAQMFSRYTTGRRIVVFSFILIVYIV